MATDLDEAIETLRTLNEPVPTPLRLPPRMKFVPPSDVQVSPFTTTSADTCSKQVTSSTARSNHTMAGGGHTELAAVLDRARASGVPDELTPVCEDDGDFYCISRSGDVVHWSHNGVTAEGWPNLATWISQVWIGGE